jgi:putative ABC transport system permease protein
MFMMESIKVALQNLGRRKLRSFLTMLGMIFGVSAVIAMLSIGAGAESESLKTIESFGIRNIIITAKDFKPEELKQIRTESLGLHMRDVEAIKAVIRPLPLVSAKRIVKTWQVASGKGRSDSRVLGVSSTYADINNLKLLEGTFFLPFDNDSENQVCVLGITAKQKLFGFGNAVGERVKINDQWLNVIGVLADATVGNKSEFEGVKIQNPNNDIYIPIYTSIKKFDVDALENQLNEVVVQIPSDPGVNIKEQSASINSLMSTMHRYVDDFSLVVPEKLLEQSQKTQAIFNIVMGAIASISLVVGGIGIMNIMLATVSARSREIGIRRCIGASRADIGRQFLLECLVITSIGGILGIALGVEMARLISDYAKWRTIVSGDAVLLSLCVAVTTGIIFGLYPAVRAASIEPMEALRAE